MPEAVIVATARTPIGRANKGSLVDCRPDDLSATIVKAVLAKVPGLDPATRRGRASGATRSRPARPGYNIARVVAILAGIPNAPGATVNRYCSSSLQTIRMAAHAIKAGEGDVFVAGGVETVSRFAKGMSDGLPGTHNAVFAEAEERTDEARTRAAQGDWTPSDGPPRRLHRDGRDGRERRRATSTSRASEMDEFAALSQNRAVDRAGERLLRARDHAGHARPTAPSSSKDDGPRPGTTVEKLVAAQAGVPARRHRHRRATRAR